MTAKFHARKRGANGRHACSRRCCSRAGYALRTWQSPQHYSLAAMAEAPPPASTCSYTSRNGLLQLESSSSWRPRLAVAFSPDEGANRWATKGEVAVGLWTKRKAEVIRRQWAPATCSIYGPCSVFLSVSCQPPRCCPFSGCCRCCYCGRGCVWEWGEERVRPTSNGEGREDEGCVGKGCRTGGGAPVAAVRLHHTIWKQGTSTCCVWRWSSGRTLLDYGACE